MAAPRFSTASLADKLPPQNIEAEMSALGSMMLSDRAAEEVSAILDESDFYSPAHREVYKAIRQLTLESKAIDLLTVKNELQVRGKLEEVGGVESLIQIAESVPSASNAAYYAGIVQDMATLRRLESAGHDIVRIVHDPELGADEKVDEAEATVFQVGQKRLRAYPVTGQGLLRRRRPPLRHRRAPTRPGERVQRPRPPDDRLLWR
jgi:replicative DNA helicase